MVEERLVRAEVRRFPGPARVIVEGDKEKYQQLITRPAPGFEGSRGLIAFGCGVEVPEQPRMDPDDFEDLEDRLLDDR